MHLSVLSDTVEMVEGLEAEEMNEERETIVGNKE